MPGDDAHTLLAAKGGEWESVRVIEKDKKDKSFVKPAHENFKLLIVLSLCVC